MHSLCFVSFVAVFFFSVKFFFFSFVIVRLSPSIPFSHHLFLSQTSRRLEKIPKDVRRGRDDNNNNDNNRNFSEWRRPRNCRNDNNDDDNNK